MAFPIALLLAALIGLPLGAAEQILVPYVLREDFQGEGLGQMASYPPVQDIGYDPSISSTTEYDAPGGRALMRVVKPVRAGDLHFGFIRRVNLEMAEGAEISFAYRLRMARSGDRIEIGLAGADGRRYSLAFAAEGGDQWRETTVALGRLRSADGKPPAAGTGIEAVYFVAGLQNADPDITYRFLIDNLTLRAAREAAFAIRTPRAVEIDPWPALPSAVAYQPGRTIAIEASAPVQLRSAECVIRTQDGRDVARQPLYDDGTHGDQRSRDGVWTNAAVYTPGASDAAGVWTALLRGMDRGGRGVNTRVRFVMRPAGRKSHPRLFFDETLRASLVARTRDPKTAALWHRLQAAAEQARNNGNFSNGGETIGTLDPVHLLPTLPTYFTVISPPGPRIAYNALEAWLTGNPVARDAAKSALLEIARWKRWAPPWFRAHGQYTYYPAGQLAAHAAFGYDLLYNDLSEPERELVRHALFEHSLAAAYKEYVLDNRHLANTSNWLAQSVGGALMSAAALVDDGLSPEQDTQLDMMLNGLLMKFEEHLEQSYLPDGSPGEPLGYHEFDLENTSLAIAALNRVFGVDYWPRSHVKDSLTYPLYVLGKPRQWFLDMGDTGGAGGQGTAAAVRQSRDPAVRWYYDQFEHSSIIDFLFFDDAVPPRPPSTPTSQIFPDKGAAVFRTGWGYDDVTLLFRAGPNFNHNHSDQGSFLLHALGETLVTESGYTDYYKDPYFEKYFRQAIGHNTVLVDGDPESQSIADTRRFRALDLYPRITGAITSEFYDAVASELQQVYRGRLSRYSRRIVFLKPDYFVVYDDLAAVRPARFDWLLHLPDRARATLAGSVGLYRGEKASLGVRVVSGGLEARIEDGQRSYSNSSPAQPAVLSVRTPGPVDAAQFLIALVPARTTEAAQAFSAGLRPIRDASWDGVETARGDLQDLVLFRRGTSGGERDQGDWTTDAAALTVTQAAQRIEMFAVQASRALRRRGQTLFTSDRALDVAARFAPRTVELSVHAPTAAKLHIATGFAPREVTLDGGARIETRYDQGLLEVPAPAGRHRISIHE